MTLADIVLFDKRTHYLRVKRIRIKRKNSGEFPCRILILIFFIPLRKENHSKIFKVLFYGLLFGSSMELTRQ